jgi:hypothetical protein
MPRNTIFETAATMRAATELAEATRLPLCVLSLEFQEATDKVSHIYLFTILKFYGFSKRFIERILPMYEKAVSSVQVNGHLSGPFPIRCSVEQGCMLLFALCLNPLLRILLVIRIGRRTHKTAVVAYVDDVTLFVTAPEDIPIIRKAIQC